MKKIFLVLLSVLFFSTTAFAGESTGISEITYKGFKPNADLKREAYDNAIKSAFKTYIEEKSYGTADLFYANEDKIDIKEFLSNTQVVSEEIMKKFKRYKVIVKITVNDKALDRKLASFNKTGKDRGYVAALFVGRDHSTTSSLDDKRIKSGNFKGRDANDGTNADLDYRSESDGSNVRTSDSYVYKAQNDQLFSGAFKSEADKKKLVVTSIDDIVYVCKTIKEPKAFLQNVRESLVKNSNLRDDLRRSVFQCVKEAGIGLFLYATVDLSETSKNRNTGLYTTSATVTGTLVDLSGTFPRDIVTGEPKKMAGEGTSTKDARDKAIYKSSVEFSSFIVDKINASGI